MDIIRKSVILAAALLTALAASAEGIVYHNASEFPLFGKCIDSTSARYERFPAAFEKTSRKTLWDLSRNSAGLYLRFRTNSTCVVAKWKSTSPSQYMPHMTDAGDNGLDLYILTEKDGWRFAGSGFEWNGRGKEVKTKTLISNMKPQMRECILYLSLYNGITDLEIGVDDGAVIEGPAVDSPKSGDPVVMYGSSILQGCSASRPGMVFTSIIERKLDREVINLGFSGNALLDLEVAEYMTRVENPSLFVLDYVPNASVKQIEETGEKFFRILRDAHPGVPVVFIEDPTYPHSRFDERMRAEIESKNIAQKALFQKLKKAGEKKIYYVSTDGLIGDDGEATVDGIHFTDLGMVRYTEKVLPVIRKALKAAGK